MPTKIKTPGYLLHKSTGQARVRINGKDIYLGIHGSPESLSQYQTIILDWLKANRPKQFVYTVDDLALLFLDHAKSYYRKGDAPTSEVTNILVALRPLTEVCGTLPVSEFRPTDLHRVRDVMIKAGCVRTSINRQIGRIKRMFKWGVEHDMVPPSVLTGVQAVTGLRSGRSKAAENPPVGPVSNLAVEAIRPFVSRQVWGMIQLQLFTGMRPGEAVIIRGCDLDTSQRVWVYVPNCHKTEHHGRRRTIMLGPKAQAILKEFLKTDTQAYLFSPADARDEFDERRRSARRSKVTPSQASRGKLDEPRRSPGPRYTVCSYGQAVRKACERAFGMPAELRNVPNNVPEPQRSRRRTAAKAWREQNCWHVHQLRHSAGTAIRREAGLDAARAVLGHASMAMTEVYAEQDVDKAQAVIARIG